MNKKLMRNFIFVGLVALIVCGNFLTALAVETYVWEEKASMGDTRHSFATVSTAESFFVLGGMISNPYQPYLKSVKMYNPTTNSWEAKADMLIGKRSFAASYYNNKIYVFGGQIDNTITNSVEIYDIQSNTWSSGTDMPTSRYSSEAITVGDKIYIIGGRHGYNLGDETKQVEIYDPKTDTWEVKSQMPFGRLQFGIETVDSKIYIVGGSVFSNPTVDPSSRVDCYNTTTDSWSAKSDTLATRAQTYLVVDGNKVLAVTDGETSIEIYDPYGNTWNLSSVSIPNNVVKVYGAELVNDILYILYKTENSDLVPQNLLALIKSAKNPSNLTATPGDAQVLLNWDPVTGADTYTVKRSTTTGGTYTTIAENITETSYLDTVINGNTYYYVVTAVNTAGESEPSNEASATPIAPVVSRALLNITMEDSLIKEYDLSMSQVNSFINWYNSSTGSELYSVEKFANIGPFLSRKDYLVKGKIVCFEVMEYVN